MRGEKLMTKNKSMIPLLRHLRTWESFINWKAYSLTLTAYNNFLVSLVPCHESRFLLIAYRLVLTSLSLLGVPLPSAGSGYSLYSDAMLAMFVTIPHASVCVLYKNPKGASLWHFSENYILSSSDMPSLWNLHFKFYEN